MKIKAMLFTLLFCMLLASVGSVNAQSIDYGEGFQILPSNYIAPKMDCERSGGGDIGQKCVLLAYDNTTKKLELFSTWTRFLNDTLPLTPTRTILTDANYEYIIAMNPATSIPYDVVYPTSTLIAIPDQFLIYDGTGLVRKFNPDTDVLTLVHTATANERDIMAGDRKAESLWYKIDRTSGFVSDNWAWDFSGANGWATWTGNNWVSGEYVSGLIPEATSGVSPKSYILFSYNATSGSMGYSNNTDALIGAARYDGVFEREYDFSSYEYFIRNSTHVVRWDYSSNQTTAFFKFNGNVIISQSLWVSSTDVNDIVIIFQNNTGINIYNTWSSLYTAVPEEYNESIAVEAMTPDLFLGLFRANNPYYPKVACSPDFGSCALLVYDTGVLSSACGGILPTAGLKLYYTLTPDQPNWQCEYVFPESYTFTGEAADYPPNYDIRYNTADGKFRIISDTKLYEWDGSANPVNSFSFSSVTPHGQNRGVAFVDEEGDEVLAVLHHGSPPQYLASFAVTAWNSQSLGAILWTCSPLYHGCQSSAFYAKVTYVSGNTKYELKTSQWDYSAFPSVNWYNLGWQTPESNLDMDDDHDYTKAYQYYYPEEGIIFFERDVGDTPNDLGDGIYYSGHNAPTGIDWIYPTVTPYYAYDTLYAEDTESSSRYFEERKIYAVAKRGTNYGCLPFVGCGKVLYHSKSNNPVFVTTSYYDDLIGITNPLTTSMTLECLDPAINYTASAGAAFYAFQLPCNSNINLTLQTVSAYPFFHEQNFDFSVGCVQMNIEAVYIKPFTSTLTVRDQVTGSAIPSATVYVDGSPYTTDVDGQIEFIVAPTSATFDVSTVGSPTCLITLDATGGVSSESHYLYVTKTGYYPWTGTVALDPDGYTIYLNQGEFIVSRVYYKDGIEATGLKTSALINATGADQIYVIRIGIPYNESQDNDFPVTFQTIDASSSYSVTLGLTWGNFTDTTVVSVTPAKNNYGCNENACFELPFYSTDADVGCATDLDCEDSYCLGNIFKELTSCNTLTGQCMYQQTACPTFCDNDIGCYTTIEANESCNFDTECYDLIRCISTAVLKDASCSPSLGVCVTEHVQCTYGCDLTTDACIGAPSEVVCDQSTVVGMLGCTQAGIMGFIGSTYDPMFMLLLVIAIVIITVTLLSLAVKGISNVIR